MEERIRERVKKSALLFIKRDATIRSVAKEMGVSKSTVSNDFNKKLELINPELYAKVREKLDKNWNEKHIRGGDTMKKRWGNK